MVVVRCLISCSKFAKIVWRPGSWQRKRGGGGRGIPPNENPGYGHGSYDMVRYDRALDVRLKADG